jgi:hypothetical protein
MAINTEMLVIAAVRLRQSQPELWGDFLRAMDDYATQSARAIIQATPEYLLKAQGMAVTSAELAAVLRGAPETYDKLREYREKKAGRVNG